MNMKRYPFPAIVGQEKLKKALLLCAVNPGIGGVLIKGEKGTAKTTSVRALAELMPPVEVGEELLSAPFVDLPLGASADRVLGSLDIEVMIAEKRKRLLPGLLAEAHQGILYIDEVNLLADHLVDVLLDVAASGMNTVQREGLSESHPARFVLIGTMNPEEGNLRPQFLDRFGLMVEAETHAEVAQRTEVVKRRMAFEQNPELFLEQWQSEKVLLQDRIQKARARLSSVQMPEGLLTLISELCIKWAVGSLRADIVLYKTAVTLAAWNGRRQVTPGDVGEAAELVLPHRRGKRPLEEGERKEEERTQEERENGNANAPGNGARRDAGPQGSGDDLTGRVDRDEWGDGSCEDGDCEVAAPISGMNVPEFNSGVLLNPNKPETGKRLRVRQAENGVQLGTEKYERDGELAVAETLVHAYLRDGAHFDIQKADLHRRIRDGKAGHLILFVVDASGSMAAGKRMEAVKGSVLSLLENAYQKRDMVAVIAFRGVEASILLEPTRSIAQAEEAMASLPTGGRTPLPHALELAGTVLARAGAQGRISPFLVLWTDGKANVSLHGGGDPWEQSLSLAAGLREAGAHALILDTENGYVRQGRAGRLAQALGAEYIALESLSAADITATISARTHQIHQSI